MSGEMEEIEKGMNEAPLDSADAQNEAGVDASATVEADVDADDQADNEEFELTDDV